MYFVTYQKKKIKYKPTATLLEIIYLFLTYLEFTYEQTSCNQCTSKFNAWEVFKQSQLCDLIHLIQFVTILYANWQQMVVHERKTYEKDVIIQTA